MNRETISYIGSIGAVIFGAALLWFTPPLLIGEAATVGLAIAFAVGGFGGLGATVAIPAVRASAVREAYGTRAAAAARKPRAPRAPRATPTNSSDSTL